MKYLFVVLAFLISLNGFAGESLPIVKKLVDGSPWVFTTKYENTVMQFRLTAEGEFQRQSQDGEWKKVTLTEDGRIVWQTVKGHQIDIRLNETGEPVATHSKHASTFKSQHKDP
ncbi:hypothetical protein [Undibacterium sp. TS12]|uniref:hypothetical protein n=1 Tax=Undibacterium sp. TS12 TaxID=2908202 RepID=UPI001F4D32E5|nr:hypothetical protein [Undibacterium sp. TS12]MCH8617716.1 hypothetical protein [Undibacterium sp. TS12]